MASQIESEADGRWAVWVHDDDQLDTAAAELASYRAQPEDRRYLNASAAATELRTKADTDHRSAAKRGQSNARPFDQAWYERLGICTTTLIALSVAVFAVQLVNESLIWRWLGIIEIEVRGDGLYGNPQDFLPEVRKGELWRLVTPVLTHSGPLHLLMNLLLFAQLASAIETRYGWNRLLALILSVAIFSNLLEYLFSSPAFRGLSGVVFGLFGFIWIQWKYYPNSGFIVPPNITFMMLFWFVFCIVGLGGEIANFVHWGGLASGALIGYVTAILSRER